MKVEDKDEGAGQGVLSRAFGVLRVLAEAQGERLRLTDIAARTGQAPATAHRVLQALIQEDMVEQPPQSKAYQLSVAFFALAASAGNRHSTLREICRPALLRLSGMLNDTVFLLVRHGFDAVCLDRIDGPFPVRSHTGDIGGKVPLGLGQAGLILLARLPEAEREEIIRFNIPRLRHLGFMDEISVRVRLNECLAHDYALSTGPALYPGTMGLAVPITDRSGTVVAALSVAAPSERMSAERLPMIVQMLRKEASQIGAQVNPFDPALRRPNHFLGQGGAAPGMA
ncbi:IclR family transcriptional regulator [Bordetella hinzii]|uniref:IclR family transcriptional regulator n=2 Tax=Bordetella hinzii TaxID=103855 RepID=A0AAN1RUA5_9BORD|nr:IclR family transcriptional regulator [Bordetella hinzii]AKQ54020.1 Transcriptional regulator KdgR [Bordetella hinzii]AKQ58511.1 Transcriptional regulator KdgR [Bordetella hinzii]AZW16179.1 IclR family transcriptional regulator [Bordetella hinzii]KCB22487.1 transcriptional regulator, IclR family, C-terminal domain protein [Bordetella hinzii OH87 BAL007II]KCB29194.1 transcriptional regulator, IclR family, C-terminal domain protein [Bordetella hinzii CA90 BAL1384]